MSENKVIHSFDQHTFLANFCGMEDLACEVINCFVAALPKYVSDIEIAIRSGNTANLELSAHTLKGALSNFHAKPSQLVAWQLEQMGHDKVTEKAEVVFDILKSELARLSTDLQILANQRQVA